MTVSNSGPILIIGGGLAGVALAQGLHKHGIDFLIFERDTAPDTRWQGYRIKLFPNTVPDLQYLLSEETFQLFEQTCAETVMGETTLNALNASPIASRKLYGPEPYTVDRGILRQVLLGGLEENKVHWGKSFTRYEVSASDDTVIAHFEDGSSFSGSLLVGADGNRSPVRKQFLPDHKTVDAEGCCLYGRTPITSELLQRLNASTQKWLTVCRDTAPVIQEIIFSSDLPVSMFVEKMHFAHRETYPELLSEDYMYWSMLLPSKLVGPTEALLKEALSQPPRQLGLKITSEWDPSIRCLLEHQDDAHAAVIRIISAAPDLINWTPSVKVTLIGDAIHVMSPGGGVGAVTALKDAAVLTKSLVKDGISASSVGAYEAEMREYAGASIARSYRGGLKFFGQPAFEDCKAIEI